MNRAEDWLDAIGLLVIGAFVTLGKELSAAEKPSLRVCIGRVIIGSSTSLVAGLVLMQFPNLNFLAVLGLGSAFGIAGSQVIEMAVRGVTKRAAGSSGEST
ncbi:holin [Dyella sp. M7H15-1]|uniref:holin n=1 Tax=Dyella sp. M7H15-1 TaxID=2501295 RepID=UPI00197AAACF|nr:holin [Dyella sp. M7H15-1]